MKRKVLDINENGEHIICIKDDSTGFNPYRVYEIWWNGGWHRKQIAKYQDFTSVLYRITDIYNIY